MAGANNRTGVFFCNCEGKFSDSLDFKAIKKQLQLSTDEIVQEVPGLCKEEGQSQLSRSIGAAALNGLVIAGCREGRLNKQCLNTAGLHGIGPEKVTFVNLQDLCVNVHPPGQELNLKAGRITQRALVGQRLQTQIQLKQISVSSQVLVIGNGAEASRVTREILANQPVAVIGSADRVKVPGATYYEDCKLVRAGGHAGNFNITLHGPAGKTELQAGGIVLALETTKTIDPSLCLPAEPGILPLSSFSTQAEHDWSTKSVAFLLSDGEHQAPDSTSLALDQALELRQRYGTAVQFFFKNLQVASAGLEHKYTQARQHGIKFNRYAGQIDVHTNVLGITIKYLDPSLPATNYARVLVDYLVCGEVCQPCQEWQELTRVLQLHLGANGFFQTESVHLLTGKSTREGIYFVGPCLQSMHVMDVDEQAQVVATRLTRFADGTVVVPQLQPVVDADKCALCLTCFRTCARRAVEIDYEHKCTRISSLACQLCGTCAAECPAQAIELPKYNNQQMFAQLHYTGKIVAFACENSGYPAAELAGSLNCQYTTCVELIKVPCVGKIDAVYILQALEQGARGVLLLACHQESCKGLMGTKRAEYRLTRIKKLLASAGINPQRVYSIHLAANTGHRFVVEVNKWLASLQPIDREGDGI